MSSERWAYLDLADFLLIAEATLGVSTDDLIRVTQLHLASSALDAPAAEFDGVEFYPDFATKVAVLCSRIVKNHALPDGNKRVGYMRAVEFAERNGFDWESPQGDDPGGERDRPDDRWGRGRHHHGARARRLDQAENEGAGE